MIQVFDKYGNQILATGSSDLASVLDVGNTTGGTDILISAADFISNPSGNSQINLGGASDIFQWTDDAGAEGSAEIYGSATSMFMQNPFGTIEFEAVDMNILHGTKINLDAPIVNFPQNTLSTLAGFDASKNLVSLTSSINTTAGDSATINSRVGRFRKDTTGTTFTLTNSFITANSIIQLTLASDPGITGFDFFVVAGAGSAVITFTTSGVAAAPTNNLDVNFLVIN